MLCITCNEKEALPNRKCCSDLCVRLAKKQNLKEARKKQKTVGRYRKWMFLSGLNANRLEEQKKLGEKLKEEKREPINVGS